MNRWIAGLAGLWVAVAGAAPEDEFRPDRLEAMDAAVGRAIAEGKAPGAVVWIERHGEAYHRAFGRRAVVPAAEEMTEDTIFDAASLTKVIATTSAVMKLVEQGKIDPERPASVYLPDFTGQGKEAITVRQLLTHESGLKAGLWSPDPWEGRAGAWKLACAETPYAPPGSSYRYSDINFIVLGFLVERVAGTGLEVFCQREIFGPLGMKDTRYLPESSGRIAPTERLPDGTILRGVVHDPTARKMGGVAGHAGLFLTAGDLARFARMMLSGGELEGTRVFQPETVRAMTTVRSAPDLPRRGYGWDIDSPYAGPRGSFFPIGSYGHNGWTGTSLWIDPFSETFVILLSNRNHPAGGSVLALQKELATLTAQAVRNFNLLHVPGALAPDPAKKPPLAAPVPVFNGIDVLERDGFRSLQGLKIGLVTNHTGQNRSRSSTIDLLHDAPGVKLLALFSPEHGIRGELDSEKIDDTTDSKTGLPVHSLYGKRRSPAPEQLAGLDALVFDVQDIGCRFYTYISTMEKCLEQAGKSGVPFIVLDRVNPIGGLVEGPVLSGDRSFIAAHEIPVRHGMTVGELAGLMNAERKFGANLTVVKCDGGSPLQWFDRGGLPWRDPSPNMRSLATATLYPGIGLLEFCRLSVGRGTGTPFEIIGAPYIDDIALAADLNRAGLAGISFVPVRFTPASSVFEKEECGGVRMTVTDRDALRPVDLGVTIAAALHRLYAEKFNIGKMLPLLGDRPTLDAIRAGKSVEELHGMWSAELIRFAERRRPYLLYPR